MQYCFSFSYSSVKPPIFDLFLAIVIALYILFVYILVQVGDEHSFCFAECYKDIYLSLCM